MALNIDELNNLSSGNFREYFEVMGLNKSQINKRVEHSEKLSPILFYIINLVKTRAEYGYTNFDDVVEELREDYIELLGEEGVDVDNKTLEYIALFALLFVETTVSRLDIDFFVSIERANAVAENEANVIFNNEDFKEAISKGLKYKIWITEQDELVRDSHKAVDSAVLEIDQYFQVGDSYMLYPKDMSMSPSLNETANCRCHVEYF